MRTTEQEIRPYLERLEALPFVRHTRLVVLEPSNGGVRRPVDAMAVIGTPSGEVELAVELKRTKLTHELAQHLVHLGTQVPHLLVLAPAVGGTVGDLFVREGIDYVDLAGNCHVHVDDRYLAHVQGRRAAPRPVAARALRGPAYRVIFSLLADPRLARATARALSAAAGGVSPQTASDARARLVASGVLLETRTGLRWATDGWKRALDLFLMGFPTLAPGLTVGRYRARERTPDALERALVPRLAACEPWRWGGGAAAARLDGHYRGDETIVHFGDAIEIDPRQLVLVPDPSGDVVLKRAPGPLAFEGPRGDCAHPLLVYTDLLAEGHDRAREGAAEIYDRYLVPIAQAA